jgi:hypothetical protein
MGQQPKFQETLRRLAMIDKGFVETRPGWGLVRPGQRPWIPKTATLLQ